MACRYFLTRSSGFVLPERIPAIILDRVMKKIESKPEQEANVLKLALVNQYRPGEISKLVELSAGAIRMIVHRFRQEIKDEYRWAI